MEDQYWFNKYVIFYLRKWIDIDVVIDIHFVMFN